MNILGVSGSLRAASFNTALLRAAQELAPDDVTIRIFGLHDLPLFNQDVEDAGDPPSVTAWKDAIRASDALLLACPEYNGGVTGVLKNAIDWASRGKPAPLTGKICCLVGAALEQREPSAPRTPCGCRYGAPAPRPFRWARSWSARRPPGSSTAS